MMSNVLFFLIFGNIKIIYLLQNPDHFKADQNKNCDERLILFIFINTITLVIIGCIGSLDSTENHSFSAH